MILFHSMTEVTVWITVVVFFLLLFALRVNPFRAAGAFVQELFTNRKFLLHFLALIGILFMNKVELILENRMVQKNDFTSDIYRLEGDFVAAVQHLFRSDWLTIASSFFYVVVFTAIMVASLGIYTYQKNHKLFYAVCYAMMFNYMIAIPFYLFFPVNEVWYYASTKVEFLMTSVFPTFEQEYRPLSGLNNCFPSLHTSLSVTMAVIAWKSNSVFWRRFTIGSAAFIIFSIFYLGIHWLTDMCGGLLLGLFAGTMALRLSEGRSLFQNYVVSFLKNREVGKNG